MDKTTQLHAQLRLFQQSSIPFCIFCFSFVFSLRNEENSLQMYSMSNEVVHIHIKIT